MYLILGNESFRKMEHCRTHFINIEHIYILIFLFIDFREREEHRLVVSLMHTFIG